MNLMSVHLPKTAGGTFSRALKTHYGDRYFYYVGDPRTDPQRIREKITDGCCVHGHYCAKLFSDVPDAVFVTWMRHPVDRLISHYYYSKHMNSRLHFWKKKAPIHRKMLRENWSFERFATGKEHRNLYSVYLEDFPLERFAFIGITEYFSEDYRYFCDKYLGGFNPVKSKNRNPRPKQEISEDLKKQIEELNAEDIELYHRALEARSLRMEGSQ